MLFQRGADIRRGQLLHHAAMRQGPDTIELISFLLELGAPINEIQYTTHELSYRLQRCTALGTPLQYAAEKRNANVVSYLLQRGADPSIKSTRGNTALETARYYNKEEDEVIQILLGAQVKDAEVVQMER